MFGRRTIIRNQQDVVGVSSATLAESRPLASPRPRAIAKRRRSFKSTTIAAYTGVFLLVMSLVAVGYQPPQKKDSVANAVTPQQATVAQANMTPQQPSIDQLVATNVAADMAERANLSVAPNIANLSMSLSIDNQLAQTASTNIISKPQIVQPTANSRVVRQYTTKAGDTAPTVAAQYGVSADTVKWANSLQTDAIEPGRTLTILPVDGIQYTVKPGDTIDSLASKYNTSSTSIVAFNDLEIGGLTQGAKIIIPGGVLPTSERPGYIAPRVRSATTQVTTGGGAAIGVGSYGAGSRFYAFGNCTAYAYDRRSQLGLPVGDHWGNASTWAMYASAAGLRVDHTPSVGAIIQWDAYGGAWIGYAGHVGVVEAVNGDGSIVIS
jgi:N-acetylmuramoyl-L-alanine amidase